MTTDLGNDPDTTPLPVLDPGPDPAEAAATTAGTPTPATGTATLATGTATPATGPRPATYRTAAVHQTLLNLCAQGLVVTVIPLVVLQIPDAVAWVVPPRVAAAGPGAVASLLRASGLALPAMAVAGSLAALMVRWLRAGPVLLAGLLILAAADALGGLVRTVVLIGADRSLHRAGAGIAAAGVVAVVTERRTQTQAPNGAPRVLAASWAAVMVAGLAAAPELMRHRVGAGDWVVALQPVPWLTGAALALGALYALLAEGTATGAARHLFPAAERTQLALLTAPVAGICAIALAVTYPGGQAVTAAAVADALALAGIAAITARAATAARFAAVCAVTGFTVSPAGVVILLAGVVVGYLAAGAVQLHAIAGAVTAPAARAALASAAGHWALVAAAVTGAVALAMACTPVRGPAASWIMGKLTL